MFLPDIISDNILKVYRSKKLRQTRRCIKSEDFSSWCEGEVKSLRNQCLDTIVTNWTKIPIINEFPIEEDARYVLDKLPTDLPFGSSIFYIYDELYWRRAFKKRWPAKILPTKPVKLDYDIPNQFDRLKTNEEQPVVKINTWKCFYVERHLQDSLEHLKPENYIPEQMKELIELTKDYIIRLKLNQLQAPADQSKERIPLHVILPALTNLKQLNICFKQTYVGDDFSWHVLQTSNKDIENLSKGLRQCRLDVLRIINTDVTCDKITMIACYLVGNKNLRVLDFSHCKIGDNGVIAICKLLLELPQLEELNLMNNFIEFKGVEFLCFTLCKNINLKQLDLNLNNFGGTGANFLARAFAENAQLTRLNLSACGLTINNVELLIKALETNTSLMSLDLSNNRLNEDIGKLFVELLTFYNFSLQMLDLRMCWISSDIVLEIENILHSSGRKSNNKNIIDQEKATSGIKESGENRHDKVVEFPIFQNVEFMESHINNAFDNTELMKNESTDIDECNLDSNIGRDLHEHKEGNDQQEDTIIDI